jgi:omega-6 fatty acid desaturase (delta-12 desaturase)
MSTITGNQIKKQKPAWVPLVAKYQEPVLRKSIGQILNTFIPFIVLWYLMYRSLEVGYWLTLLLAIPTAGFMVRIFIIQHDCGHNAFFKSKKANDTLGAIAGVITLTPYFHWRHRHAIHHATASNLDKRGVGDVPTMTVEEYLAAPPLKRFGYRIFRSPLVMFVVIPFLVFFVANRFSAPKSPKRERASVRWTNVAAAATIIVLGFLIGWQELFLIQFPASMIAAAAGTWLFFVQHQFEDTYWEHDPEWDFTLAGLEGSSYYKLPKVLQWFTGNIGFHHIHHLSPRIPNYNLEKCHEENPLFQRVITLTLRTSLHCTFLSLWDEETDRLVSFGDLKLIRQRMTTAAATATPTSPIQQATQA